MRYNIILITIFIVNFASGQLVVAPGLNNTQESTTISECGAVVTEGQLEYMVQTKSIRDNINLNNFRAPTIPITAHIIVENLINPESEFSQTDVDIAIAQLNATFNQVGLDFEQCSNLNYISEEDEGREIYPNISVDNDLWINKIVENTINIFFVQNIYNYSGYATFPFDAPENWVLIEWNSALNESTLAHEVGHYLNLYHTFQGHNELVARPQDGSNICPPNELCNCGFGIGDDLCDTPADPEGMDTEFSGDILPGGPIPDPRAPEEWEMENCATDETAPEPCTVDNNNSSFGCDLRDSNGERYNPNPTNIMSYSHPGCRTYFSPQQIERMLISLVVDRPELLSGGCEDICREDANYSSFVIHNEPDFEVLNVSDYISSRATVVANGSPNAATIYNAGKYVCLNPSFEAEYGSTFLAFIDGCEPVEPRIGNLVQNVFTNSVTIQPNPFSNQTVIVYDILTDNLVTILVSDIMGKNITTLVKKEHQLAGKHQVNFDGSNLPSGIYYCTIQAGDQIETKKMVLTK